MLLHKRDSFPFSNVRIAHIDGNIPQNHFHDQQSKLSFSELLVQLKDFISKAKGLLACIRNNKVIINNKVPNVVLQVLL